MVAGSPAQQGPSRAHQEEETKAVAGADVPQQVGHTHLWGCADQRKQISERVNQLQGRPGPCPQVSPRLENSGKCGLLLLLLFSVSSGAPFRRCAEGKYQSDGRSQGWALPPLSPAFGVLTSKPVSPRHGPRGRREKGSVTKWLQEMLASIKLYGNPPLQDFSVP